MSHTYLYPHHITALWLFLTPNQQRQSTEGKAASLSEIRCGDELTHTCDAVSERVEITEVESVDRITAVTDCTDNVTTTVTHLHTTAWDTSSSSSSSSSSPSSRICAVAQYAVLEANAKGNGIGEIWHPSPSKTLWPIWMPLQIHHYVPRESMCKMWLKSIQPLPPSWKTEKSPYLGRG